MVSMRQCYLAEPVEPLCFGGRKLTMVSGPRQSGKIAMAKKMLKKRGGGKYFNWDEFEFRHAWAKNPSAVIPKAGGPESGCA